ncbi:MAG TPA: wax ester/triacylglycerol synthase family O-acyltransferase [Solirubrobacterales bacterium]|jgi:WS/DGAT/MGAT family acyltransferase
MGEQLTALDATFLELEEADQSAHMHIGGVIVLEPGPAGGAPPIAEIRRDVASRLPDLPRYRQRLSSPRTGGLHWPTWEEDREFRIERHVCRAGLPAPGGLEELCEWAGEHYSQRLDRTRPLWEMTILELADGRWAIVTKTHHCMVDGVGSVDIANTLLDSEPSPRTGSAGVTGNGRPAGPGLSRSDVDRPTWRRAVERASRPAIELGHAGVRAAETGLHVAESIVGVAAHPNRARDALHRSRALAELLLRDEVISAPESSLNRPIGAKRRLAVIGVELEELKGIRGVLGGTVNDVVLAAAAGGLRKLLLDREEEPPPQGLRAMVPMNVRTAGERLAMGNRISSLFVHLPVSADDPGSRYRLQVEEAESLKSGTQHEGSSLLLNVGNHMPPVLHSFMARSLFATRLFNVTITNVPGPQIPLYYFGSRVQEIWPLVPIAAEHAVGLAVFSYDGTLFFCVNADRDTVEDLDVLMKGIAESVAELRELAAARVA